MKELISAFDITLKKVSLEDLETLVSWRNDPRVLPNMDDTRQVTYKVMVAWFNRVSSLENVAPYVAFKGNVPFAYVEFTNIDKVKDEATGGCFFDPNSINSGLFLNLFLAREIILRDNCVGTIIAKVRKTNKRSCKIQENFGGLIYKEDDEFNYYKLSKLSRGKSLERFSSMLGYQNDFDKYLKDWFNLGN